MSPATTPEPPPDVALGPKALREAHAHLHLHGRSLSMLDLSSCTTRADALDRIERHAAAMTREPAAEWLLGFGLRVNGFTDDPRWPHRLDLDRIARGLPACIMSFDHHSVVASSAVLTACGIGPSSADPPGGVICRDASGTPDGVLLEAAAIRAWNAAPQPDASQWRRYVEAGLADLASHGFTEVHDLLSPSWLGPLLAALDDQGRLPVRVRLHAPLDSLEAQARAGWSHDRVRLAGGKVFADGTLNSRTAWTLVPFRDPLPGHPCGTPLMDRLSLAAAMRRAHALNLGLAVHAIGDGAVRTTLDAAADVGGGGFIGDLPRLRVEHAELIDPDDVGRFAAMEVVASVQPCHLLADAPVLARQFPDHAHRVLPLRRLVDSGCEPGRLLWFGSDTPIVRPHPEDSMLAATRRDPSHALTRSECLACFASGDR
jgi:predicted amidohydrolase YtcJ